MGRIESGILGDREKIMDTEKTVIALFPEIDADVVPGKFCQSYEHIGQHGAADRRHVVQRTRPANAWEYKELFDELIKIGYNLVIWKRWNRKG